MKNELVEYTRNLMEDKRRANPRSYKKQYRELVIIDQRNPGSSEKQGIFSSRPSVHASSHKNAKGKQKNLKKGKAQHSNSNIYKLDSIKPDFKMPNNSYGIYTPYQLAKQKEDNFHLKEIKGGGNIKIIRDIINDLHTQPPSFDKLRAQGALPKNRGKSIEQGNGLQGNAADADGNNFLLPLIIKRVPLKAVESKSKFNKKQPLSIDEEIANLPRTGILVPMLRIPPFFALFPSTPKKK